MPPRKKRPTTSTPGTPPDRPPLPAESEIANRAYELFLRRGGEHGHDREDWLQAERELLPPADRSEVSELS